MSQGAKFYVVYICKLQDAQTQAASKDAELENELISCKGMLKLIEKDVATMVTRMMQSLIMSCFWSEHTVIEPQRSAYILCVLFPHEQGTSGRSSSSGLHDPQADQGRDHLESDVAAILHRMATVETELTVLHRGIAATGEAIMQMTESLHATDYQNDRFSAILQQLIEDVSANELHFQCYQFICSQQHELARTACTHRQ